MPGRSFDMRQNYQFSSSYIFVIFSFGFFLKKLQNVSADYCLLLNFKGDPINFCSEETQHAVYFAFYTEEQLWH
jgi:hypothetical protein